MDHDSALTELRAILTGAEHEPEPYVSLRVYVSPDEDAMRFDGVRGVRFRDGLLTFEDRFDTLTYVPNVKYWESDYFDDEEEDEGLESERRARRARGQEGWV